MPYIVKYFLFIFLLLCSNLTIAHETRNKYKKGKSNLYYYNLNKATKNFTIYGQIHPFYTVNLKTNQSLLFIKFIQKNYKECLTILQEEIKLYKNIEYKHYIKSVIMYNLDKKKINLLFKIQSYKKNQKQARKTYKKITIIEKNKNSKYLKKIKINKKHISTKLSRNFKFMLTTYKYDHILTTEKITKNLKNFKKNKDSLLYIEILKNTDITT